MGLSELLSTYGPNYLTALLTTWRITAVSFVLVMALSILITVLRVCPFKPLRVFGDFYVQVFRNIPGAVLILIVVYALPHLKLVLDYEPSVVLCTVLLGASFGSENFMTGINTIGVGQIEAARSIGLSFTQILRHVVIPQALRSTGVVTFALSACGYIGTALVAGFVGNKIDQKVRVMR